MGDVGREPRDTWRLEGAAPAHPDQATGSRPTQSLPHWVLASGFSPKGLSQVLRCLGASDPGGRVPLGSKTSTLQAP